MILKASQGTTRNFYSVDFVVLSHGSKTMITKMLYKQMEIIEPGEVLDFFSPPREDYL